jgi:hypothetical protein
MRTVPLVLLTCVVLAGDASAQSSCSKIADDKERLACYDKTEQEKSTSAEQNAAPIEKTPNSRAAYARQLRKWFLSNGVSMYVSTYEKNDKKLEDAFTKHRELYPRLVFTGYLSDAMVFQIAGSKGQVLKNAQALGFAGVQFISEGAGGVWLYDVSGATLPRCDVGANVCL